MTIKTQNQIYKDVIAIINQSLTALNISGWEVRQLRQPTKSLTNNPVIYVTFTTKNRRGWQYRKDSYNPEIDKFDHKEMFYLECEFQLSARRKRRENDTENTLNAVDVLEELKTYLISPNGLKIIKTQGYTIYQPSEIQNQDFMDDSEDFEFMPNFNITFVINQSQDSTIERIREIRLKGIYNV